MIHWLLLLVTIVLTAVANILLKYAALHRQSEAVGIVATLWELATTPALVVGITCLGVAVIAYAVALRGINLSVGYPVMTTSVVVLVTAFSTIFYGEAYTLVKAVGTVIVICGVILLSI
jgi:multidrug transporter EmrE-like cation transporter